LSLPKHITKIYELFRAGADARLHLKFPPFFLTHFEVFACNFLRTMETLAGGIWIKYIQFQWYHSIR